MRGVYAEHAVAVTRNYAAPHRAACTHRIPPAFCVYLVHNMAAEYGVDPTITSLLDEFEVHAVHTSRRVHSQPRTLHTLPNAGNQEQ